MPWHAMDGLYEAVVQATEEAVLNVLCAAETMVGIDGHRSPALPVEDVRALLTERPSSD
jgi:L-aminopeptidase/D-esterase-like protein